MLAGSAPDVAAALATLGGEVVVETKLDGIRLQAHVDNRTSPGTVRLFTRTLDEVTDRMPEITEALAALDVETLVLDGEVIALGDGGRPQPFQVTGARTASSADVDRLREEVPLTPYFFDVLHLDGEDLLDEPAHVRWERLAATVPPAWRVPRERTADPSAPSSSSPTSSRPGTRASSSRTPRCRMPPDAAVPGGSRSSRGTPSTSSCSPSSGAADGAGAGCPTSTSAPATPTRVSSSCSARPSRA